MNTTFESIKKLAFSKTGKQTSMLFIAQLIAVGLGVITSSINTRILGPTDYGLFAFFNTITGFTVLFFRFGFFSSGNVLLAHIKDEIKEREMIGTLIIIGIIIGFSYALFLLISSFFVDSIFDTNIGLILRKVSILTIALPFPMLISAISTGTNKINQLAIQNLLPKVLYVIILLILFILGHISVRNLIISTLVISVISTLVICYSYKPLFTNINQNYLLLKKKNREYGVHLYLGQIADQATYQLDGILISYFINTTQLGFYSLAKTLTSPMVMLSQSLTASLFKDFASENKIPKKIIAFNILWLSICVIGFFLIGKLIVILLFSDKFLPVIPLLMLLAIAGFFQGMYQPYNSFLAAHQQGHWMRNMSFIMTIVNLIANVIFIPLWGAMGAAIASILGTGSYFIMNIYYYNKLMRSSS